MNPEHLLELITVERDYWWNVAKRALVIELLRSHAPPPGRLIEGGLGAGGNLHAFVELGYRTTGFDIMPEAVDHCRAQGLEDVHVIDLQQPWPVPAGQAKAVVLLDVIEHVPDPGAVLEQACLALSADGAVIVNVPAGPYLMGPWDEMLGHYRRYTRKLLEQNATGAGLSIAWSSHWNAFSLPPATLLRLGDRFFDRKHRAEFPAVPPWLNRALIHCARLERRVIGLKPLPLGLSLTAVLVHR